MNKEQIKDKILEEIKGNPIKKDIKKMSLFGSYVSGNQKTDSDVDVLVEFKPTAQIGFFKLAQFQRELENVLNTSVDVVTPEAISKFFRSQVLSRAESIYEGK